MLKLTKPILLPVLCSDCTNSCRHPHNKYYQINTSVLTEKYQSKIFDQTALAQTKVKMKDNFKSKLTGNMRNIPKQTPEALGKLSTFCLFYNHKKTAILILFVPHTG